MKKQDKKSKSKNKDIQDFHLIQSVTNDYSEIEHTIKEFADTHPADSYSIKIIEKYLNYEDDDNVKQDIARANALKVLCRKDYWGMTEQYTEIIKHYISIDDWHFSDTEIVAFSVLGEYLHDTPKAELFKFLTDILTKEVDKYKNERDPEVRGRINRIFSCLHEALYGSLASYKIPSKLEIPKDTDFIIEEVNKKSESLKREKRRKKS